MSNLAYVNCLKRHGPKSAVLLPHLLGRLRLRADVNATEEPGNGRRWWRPCLSGRGCRWRAKNTSLRGPEIEAFWRSSEVFIVFLTRSWPPVGATEQNTAATCSRLTGNIYWGTFLYLYLASFCFSETAECGGGHVQPDDSEEFVAFSLIFSVLAEPEAFPHLDSLLSGFWSRLL